MRLNLIIYFSIVDRCPMYFDDGTNPWNVEENHIRVFDFSGDQYNAASKNTLKLFLVMIVTILSALPYI